MLCNYAQGILFTTCAHSKIKKGKQKIIFVHAVNRFYQQCTHTSIYRPSIIYNTHTGTPSNGYCTILQFRNLKGQIRYVFLSKAFEAVFKVLFNLLKQALPDSRGHLAVGSSNVRARRKLREFESHRPPGFSTKRLDHLLPSFNKPGMAGRRIPLRPLNHMQRIIPGVKILQNGDWQSSLDRRSRHRCDPS